MSIVVIKKRSVLLAIALVFVLAGVFVYFRAAPAFFAVETMGENTFAPISQVETDKKVVFITIDTALGEDQTPQILEVLKAKRVKATFAVLGVWMEEYPEHAKMLKESKHDVISHSYGHGRYDDMSAEEILTDAGRQQQNLSQYFDVETSYIRPPYGACNATTSKILGDAGLTPVTWQIDAQDWSMGNATEIALSVVNEVRPGDIIMLQSNSVITPQVLEIIIDELKQLDYSFYGVPSYLDGE